jgi:hypothetical protein
MRPTGLLTRLRALDLRVPAPPVSRGTVPGTLPALWPLRCLLRVPVLPIRIPAPACGFTGIAAILGRYCNYGSGGWGFESLAARSDQQVYRLSPLIQVALEVAPALKLLKELPGASWSAAERPSLWALRLDARWSSGATKACGRSGNSPGGRSRNPTPCRVSSSLSHLLGSRGSRGACWAGSCGLA